MGFSKALFTRGYVALLACRYQRVLESAGHTKKWHLCLKIWILNSRSTIGSPKRTSLSCGELDIILTNKATKGGRGSMMAIVAGTNAKTVIEVSGKIGESQQKN